eukprot:Gb_08420 [translate_table: standard]
MMMVSLSAPAPAPYHVPLAYLPRLATTTGLLTLSFGSAALILLLALDAWKSHRKKTHWIPGDSLLLGALSLQLLSLLNRPIVSISDDQKLSQGKVQDLSSVIHNNQLLILGGRVVMCVFMGNLLPSVARPRSRNLWSDMVALVISATVALVHVSYEIYIIVIENRMKSRCAPIKFRWDYKTISFLVSNITIFVSIILLVLLLGCAALASKSIQDIVSQRIPVVLSTAKYSQSNTQIWWRSIEEQAVKSWILARTCQPQYIIARSVLSSSTGFVVTICVTMFVFESMVNGYKTEKDGFDWSRIIALLLQCVFIFLGWLIICWRWFTAVVYYPRRMENRPALKLRANFHVEDFWKRQLLDLKEESKELQGGKNEAGSYLRTFMEAFIRTFRLYKLLPALLRLQIFLVLISKACWLMSEMVFSNRLMRGFLMGSAHHEFSHLYDQCAKNRHEDKLEPAQNAEFDKYFEALMYMPDENPAGVWIANRKSIHKIRQRLKKGEAEGKQYSELIGLLTQKTSPGFGAGLRRMDPTFLSAKKLLVERDFNVGKRSTKMIAVSLITVMIELSAFYEDQNPSFDIPPPDPVKDAIEACSQAWKIMDLVENSDPETVLVNKAADRLFHNLKESRRWLGLDIPINKSDERTGEAAKLAIEILAEKGREIADANCGRDSRNWKAVTAGNSLYKLCESIINSPRSGSVEEMLDEIHNSLADVVGWCMANVAGVLVEECKKWAERMEEEKVWNAVYIAGIAKGVMETVGWELNWITITDDAQFAKSRRKDNGCGFGNGVNRSCTLRKSATFHHR